MKLNKKQLLLDLLTILIGGFIWAISINMFTTPNLIAPGGVTGISVILNHFFKFPMGLTIIILNIPLLLLSYKFLGLRFVVRTAITTVITSLILDFTGFIPTFTEDRLLAAVFGGITAGLGLGLIYMRGLATGGSDVLARLLEIPFPYISYGKMLIIIDAVVITAAAVFFRDLGLALYAVIMVYISSIIIDKLLTGLDVAKLVYIISEKNMEISKVIMEKLDRGATLIEARGCYTGLEKNMLMVAVKRYELPRIKNIVKCVDERAFIIINDVSEVLGEGFKGEKK
ncbi:MAG: hypothetical protein K0S55_1887 [Clostridia bacterium]|nr:hypothetical protein [Clostridia bacterium]